MRRIAIIFLTLLTLTLAPTFGCRASDAQRAVVFSETPPSGISSNKTERSIPTAEATFSAQPARIPTVTVTPKANVSQSGSRSPTRETNTKKEPVREIGIRIGNIAPDFEVYDLGRNKVKLSDFRGQVVFLNFWATWCPYCRAETESLERLSKDLANEEFVMLRVTVGGKGETREKVEAYTRDNGVTFPVLVDLWGITASLYKVTGTPTTYIIDKKGVIRHVVVGARGWDDADNRQLVTGPLGEK